MLSKIRIRLTFFCALATGAVLLVMTCICLAVSGGNILEKSRSDFYNNADSLISYIKDQSVISHNWLAQMEHNYNVSIDIRDNGAPLLYSELRHSDAIRDTFALARQTASEQYHLDAGSFHSSQILIEKEFFSFSDKKGDGYYAAAALIPQKNGCLDIIILYSLDHALSQTARQRLLFGCGSLAAWLLLILLAWFFAGQMLRPIEKNRREQIRFVASASHELRSPLTVILSSLSAARIADSKERAHFLDAIESEGKRMSRLIDDMLILASSDSRSWSIRPEKTDPDTLLLETYEKYESRAKQCGLHFSVALPDAPSPACPLDKERIQQALSALIDNAFSYTPAGGHVELKLSSSEKNLIFSVSDDGPGIDDAEKRKIFDRFYRADPSRHEGQHFGLGLCIAREIVLLHRGKISVADTPGGGTTFLICLPARRSI